MIKSIGNKQSFIVDLFYNTDEINQALNQKESNTTQKIKNALDEGSEKEASRK